MSDTATTQQRIKERNAKAAGETRQRKKVHAQAKQLLIEVLSCALQTLTKSVGEAARKADPKFAIASLMAMMPQQDELSEKLHA